MKNAKELDTIFKAFGGIASAKQLLEKGVAYYQINQLLKDGQLVKIKRGLYQWQELPVSEMVEVARLVPKGVYCLYSAAAYHELTTFVSSEYHLAVPRNYIVTLPEYPPIKLHYWMENRYKIGIQQVKVEDQMVAMYDMEKTVCDIIRYKKKVGLDTMKEVLHTYLGKKNRNLDQLGKYAGLLGIKEDVFNLVNLLV